MAEKLVEKIPGWVQRMLIPTLESRIRDVVKEEMGNLEKIFDARFDAFSARFDAFDTKLDGAENRLSARIDDLDKRLDMAQRLAVVEAKMKDFESRN